jgi:hypothetical protein
MIEQFKITLVVMLCPFVSFGSNGAEKVIYILNLITKYRKRAANTGLIL